MRDKWDITVAFVIAVVLGVFFGQPLGRPTTKSHLPLKSQAAQTAQR